MEGNLLTNIKDANLLQVGQEFTWVGRPHRTKYILAPLQDQKDAPGMFVIPLIIVFPSCYFHVLTLLG